MRFPSQHQLPIVGCIVVVALLAGEGAVSFAQSSVETERKVTNLDLLRAVAGSVSHQALSRIGVAESSRIQLSIQPKDIAWIVEGGIVEALRARHLVITESDTAPLHLVFGVDDARIIYDNVRREGFLGQRIVDRVVRMQLSAKVVNRAAGGEVAIFSLQDSLSDTLPLSDVPRVEHPSVALTRGNLPQEGFFSNLAEPLVVIGSIAVAVLLLFHVRS